jgi:hypothetical protein
VEIQGEKMSTVFGGLCCIGLVILLVLLVSGDREQLFRLGLSEEVPPEYGDRIQYKCN